MVTIESKFIGDFKLGDNIAYNLEILELLYRAYDAVEGREKCLLCKPIILLITSIIEAILHDLHMRIKLFTIEGVRNIPSAVAEAIRLKEIDDLDKYIASAKKQDLFDEADKKFYDELDELRRLRNRIHIQNKKKDFEPDEYHAFSEKRKVQAERALEKVMRTMAKKFSRDHDYVKAFELPWDAYYSL